MKSRLSNWLKLSIKSFFSNVVLLNKSLKCHNQKQQVKLQVKLTFYLHLCNWYQIFLRSCHSCCQSMDLQLLQKRILLHTKPKTDYLNWKYFYSWILITHLILMIFMLRLIIDLIFIVCLNCLKLNFFIILKVKFVFFPSNKFYQSILLWLLTVMP